MVKNKLTVVILSPLLHYKQLYCIKKEKQIKWFSTKCIALQKKDIKKENSF